jgi:hypothetical protein
VLAITAQYAAAELTDTDRLVVPSTDSVLGRRYASEPLPRRPRRAHYNVLLEGILPTPDDRASLADVIEFRRDHRDELLVRQPHFEI